MDSAIRKLEDQHAKHKKILEDRDGEKHFDRVMAREKKDPGVHNKEYWAAVKIGQTNADNFMNKVTDYNHPDHGNALTAYRDKYNGNRENVDKDFIDKAVKMMNAPARYLPNQSYENNVVSGFQIRTPEDQAFLNKFKDYMKTKWDAVGYEGDADFYKDFWTVHPYSTLPKKTLTEDGRILTNVQNN